VSLVRKNGNLLTASGVLASSCICCNEGPKECQCQFPTAWRIIDGDENVYAKGPVFAYITIPGAPCDLVESVELDDFPNPFTPLFYWATGEINFTLELFGCSEDESAWDTLDSWSMTISLCDGRRYPGQVFDGMWQPPGLCACDNLPAVESGIEECDPCPNLTASLGSGQEWRDPQPSTGVTFTGEIDGEWTNLLNWEDATGLTPAGSLPDSGTNVSVEANVTSTAVAITVAELTIQAGAEFSVAASAADLHCYGAIERNALCEGVFGVVTVSGEAFVYGGGRNNGEIVNALVKFSGNGFNDTNGVVTGDARFDDTSRNDGTIAGDAEFYDTAENYGTVQGDGLFDGSPATNWGTVSGNGTFAGGASNVGTVALDATFGGSSDNVGTVTGNATFNASAVNSGTVSLDATFNGSASNGSVFGSGTVAGNATFNGSSTNGFAPSDDGNVGGNATFNDTSINVVGTVSGNATFNDDTINRAVVTNTATFNGCSWNDGGTAGTFVPNPPPSAYPC
jgi:hypothetical protein